VRERGRRLPGGRTPECADDRHRTCTFRGLRPQKVARSRTGGWLRMTIITAVPPPEAPGVAVEVPIRPSRVPGPLLFVGRAVRTLWSNGKARIGIVILGLIALIAIFAPLIAPHSPTATTFPPYLNPTGRNWFGTTGNGQDVFSQLVYARGCRCWSASPRASSRRSSP